jgi:hypothetical protein
MCSGIVSWGLCSGLGHDGTSLSISLLSTEHATIEIPYSLRPSWLHSCVRPPYSAAPPPPSLAVPPSHVVPHFGVLPPPSPALPCRAPCPARPVQATKREKAITGQTQARCKHSWPLLDRTTILCCRLANHKRRRMKNACCKHMFQVLQMYVASVLYQCYKVDRNVAYVAMAIHVCFKYMF